MWRDVDEGLYHALKLRAALVGGGDLQPQGSVAQLSEGEVQFYTVEYVEHIYINPSVEPHSYFHLGSKWKQDPARALVFLPVTLSVNLASKSIARARNTTAGFWRETARGWLTITNTRIFVNRAGDYRYWEMKNVRLKPDGLYLELTTLGTIRLVLPPVSQAWCYVAVRFLAFGDRNPSIKVPRGFAERAAASGRPI